MTRIAPLLAAAAWLVPVLGYAQDHGGHGAADFHVVDMAPSFLNFILLIVILLMLFRDGVSSSLRQRKANTTRAMEEAAAMKAQAEAKQKEYAERLAKLDSELEQMKRDMVEAGEAERDRIVEEAEERASRMRQETEFVVAQQAKQMRLNITREAVEAAVAAAEQLLIQTTTPQDQERLAREYLAQLEGETPSSASTAATSRQESRV